MFLIVMIAVVSVDQGSKAWASVALSEGEVAPLIDGLCELRLRHNPGGAWGLGEELAPSVRKVVLPAGGLVLAALLVAWERRLPEGHRLARAGIALVLGGGGGNMIDRLRLGEVIDFVGVAVGGEGWTMSGTFNIADVAMVAGVVLVAVGRRGETQEREGSMAEGGSA
jgi:signal peptidase II